MVKNVYGCKIISSKTVYLKDFSLKNLKFLCGKIYRQWNPIKKIVIIIFFKFLQFLQKNVSSQFLWIHNQKKFSLKIFHQAFLGSKCWQFTIPFEISMVFKKLFANNFCGWKIVSSKWVLLKKTFVKKILLQSSLWKCFSLVKCYLKGIFPFKNYHNYKN